MDNPLKVGLDEKLQERSEVFLNNVESKMHYKSNFSSNLIALDWIDEIEFACPYIDNIIRNPKVALVQEHDIVKIEKVRKVAVDSVKDLSKHTNYIDKVDAVTNEVQPSKLLIVRNEETYNTYENRFLYTLIINLSRFVELRDRALNDFEAKSSKSLEYASSSITGYERVNIELKIDLKENMGGKEDKEIKKEIENIKKRLQLIKDYLKSWQHSEILESLKKAHIAFITPPIRKTNLILKNPNFQIANRLWGYLQTYNTENKGTKSSLDTMGDNIVKGILDTSFLLDFYVLDSISASKRKQKELLSKYAVLMVSQLIANALNLLLNNGIKITDDELLNMISKEIDNQKNKKSIGGEEVKMKFKNALEEYLERTKRVI